MIDFGLSKKYLKEKENSQGQNSEHIAYAEGRSMVGTVRYVSIHTHLGIEPSRRDDL